MLKLAIYLTLYGPERQDNINSSCLLHAYEFDESNSRNRTAGTVDGVTREYGERVFREKIDRCTCPQIYNDIPTCMECLKP